MGNRTVAFLIAVSIVALAACGCVLIMIVKPSLE